MQFSNLPKGRKSERVAPSELKHARLAARQGCGDIPDEQFIEGGVNTDGLILTPAIAAKRIDICRACKHHKYKDEENRIGLHCSLQVCYTNKEGRFLVVSCRAGKWE